MALFRSRTKTSTGDPFLDTVISFTSTDGVTYTSATAIRNSDVFTAVQIISQDIASSPIQLMVNGIAEEENDLNYLLNVKPNDLMDAWHFKFAMAANMLLNGNSYAHIIRDKANTPVRLDFIPVSEVKSVDLEHGNIVYTHDLGEGKTKKYPAKDILHFKMFTTDGLMGESPLLSLRNELAQQDAAKRTLLANFRKGVNSSGILKVKKSGLDKESKDSIRQKFEESNSGEGNALRTIILDDTMEYTPIEINTEILKLVNNNVYTTKQIAKAFGGIPLDRMGIETVNTSLETANLTYLQNTLSHYFSAISSELNIKLLEYPLNRAQSFKFSTDRLREVDPTKKVENVSKLLQNSILTVNEARKEYGKPPVEGGDKLLVSLNYADLTKLDEYQASKQNKNAPISSEGGENQS
ncbi:phage portal protein [Bacillus cereus]|uniref:phage portal protein n=1 Tax=Bacillus cereus TaxID=1396 RepID=UPI002362B766|nr:phage portal protein [Bacillus cereus]MDD0822667.1 phage portal protein [Bacillus cereus]